MFDPISELPIAVESQFGTVRHPRISIPAVHMCRTSYERCSVNPKTAAILRILLSFMASIRPARTLPLDSVKQTLVRRAVGRRVWVEICLSLCFRHSKLPSRTDILVSANLTAPILGEC
jgi:hypothetical protein